MSCRFLLLLAMAVLIGVTACTVPDLGVVRPEPRPLGRDVAALEAPKEPGHSPVSVLPLDEPSEELTLRDALAQAFLKNPELAASAWEVRASEAHTLQSSLFPNPELGVEVENVVGSGEFRGTNAAETTIALSQLIELGGKRLKRVRAAALERDVSAWDYETKRLDVLTETAKAFLHVLSSQEQLALTQDLVRIAGEVLGAVSGRVQAGKVSPVKETSARVALATSRIALERATRALDAARHALAVTWGRKNPAFVRADGTLEPIKPIPSTEALARHIHQNPDIARWATELAQRQATLEREEAQRFPNLSTGGGVRRLNETRDTALVLQFSLPIPLFDRNQGGILEARYRLAEAAEELRSAETQVSAALAEAYAALAKAFTEVNLLRREVLPEAKQAFGAMSEGYRQGKFGLLDVIDAQRTLFEARGQVIEALNAYHQAVADIERLIGEPLIAAGDAPEPR